MRLLILLAVLMLFNMSFELIDENLPARDWWLFDQNEYMLTPEWYWHEIQGKVSFIILCFVLAYEIQYCRKELLLFAWINLLDGIDFLLTNNTPWFYIKGEVPVSYNMISLIVFAYFIVRKVNGEGGNV